LPSSAQAPALARLSLAVLSFSPTHPREIKKLAAFGDQITLLEYRTQNGRRPTYFSQMKYDLNFMENGRQPNFLGKMDDDINFNVNEI
jgi:hypothetical protein